MPTTTTTITELQGKTFASVTQVGEKLVFENETEIVELYHDQDCCENVYIESITGDLSDLVGFPLSFAEESSHSDNEQPGLPGGSDCSFTWTFYKFATMRGWVDVRWLGESNGYYSEAVSVFVTKKLVKDERGEWLPAVKKWAISQVFHYNRRMDLLQVAENCSVSDFEAHTEPDLIFRDNRMEDVAEVVRHHVERSVSGTVFSKRITEWYTYAVENDC